MKYYVGIRETMIDRAREASSSALKPETVAKLLQVPQNAPKGKKEATPTTTQSVDIANLTKIGATGLEPATS